MAKTLENIRSKVRQLTGRKSEADLTTAEIDFQINSFYQTEFPQQLRILDLRQSYTFQTKPNVAVYNFPPDEFQSIEPPVYVAGYTVYFTMDKPQWRALWPQLQVNETSATADGGVEYTFTLGSAPVLANSYIVSGATSFNTSVELIDNGNGTLILPSQLTSGSPTSYGTINYESGLVTITGLPSAWASGEEIHSQYVKYRASRPNLVFYYSNQITLFPVPDQVYEVEMTVYKIPTELIGSSDSPQFAVGGPPPTDQDISEWWEALAYGASMKIYENNMDLEAMGAMEQLLERKLNLIRRRTWYQLTTQRTKTIYATPTVESYPGWMYPGLFPGN